MAFHHRKLLPADEPDKKPDVDKKNDSSSPCDMCYDCPVGCPMYLSPPPPYEPAPSKHQISTTLILMLCVLGAAFLFLSYLTVRRYRSRRRNTRSTSFEGGDFREDFLDEDHGPVVDHPIWYIRTVGLPQSVIDSIAVFKYKKGEGLIEGRDCSVCLSEFQDDESLRLLPKCSHAFHLPCIDTWLRSHKNCPVCRAPVSVAAAATSTDTGGVDVVETSAGGSGPREGNRTVSNVLEGDERSDRTRGVGENSRPKPVEKLRVLSDLADNRRANVDHELRSIRRCFSVDFASASTNCTKKDEGCLDIQFMAIIEKQKLDMMAKRGSKNSSICDRLSKCSSHGRSNRKGPGSMKRSFSFSGKRSSRKHTRSLESIPIPESVCKIGADN